jgi:hypothetical protein
LLSKVRSIPRVLKDQSSELHPIFQLFEINLDKKTCTSIIEGILPTFFGH